MAAGELLGSVEAAAGPMDPAVLRVLRRLGSIVLFVRYDPFFGYKADTHDSAAPPSTTQSLHPRQF